MKKKIPKILFILSLIPYFLILIIGIISSFIGVSFFGEVYGLGAFFLSIYSMIINFTMIPILPICLLYQIFYIMRKRIKYFKNINIKKYIKVSIVIGVTIIIILVTHTFSSEIKTYFLKKKAENMIENSEEKIPYNKNEVYLDGIFDIPEIRYDHILVDYDKLEIGVIINNYLDEFWKVKLKKIKKNSKEYEHIVNDYFVQAEISLNSKGKKLISFYEGEYKCYTIAFLLIYEDGTIYYADNILEDNFPRFTGLCFSEYSVSEGVKYSN